MKIAIKIFLILGCITYGWALISLCWLIPMTVHYFHSVSEGRPVSTGYKICVFLFASFIAGILMFFDKN